MEDLERRLLRLRGESEQVTEEDLLRRLRAIKEPQSLSNLSYDNLAERFDRIFNGVNMSKSGCGTKTASANGSPNEPSPLDDTVAAYLAAAEEQCLIGENLPGSIPGSQEFDMVSQAFLGNDYSNFDLSHQGNAEDTGVAQLLQQAQDAVRLSKNSKASECNHLQSSSSEVDEDDEMARIIIASREEAELDLKYSMQNKPSTLSDGKKGRRKKKKKKKKRKNKGSSAGRAINPSRRRSYESCGEEDSESSSSSSRDSLSDSDSGLSRSSSIDSVADTQNTVSTTSRSSSPAAAAAAAAAAAPVTRMKSAHVSQEEEYRREEEDTMNRLRAAVREEGKESELVRILAKRLITLRKSRKNWTKQQMRFPVVLRR